MTHEQDDPRSDSLDTLAALDPDTKLYSVALETVTPGEHHHPLFFVVQHPTGPYIKIDSPTRKQFAGNGQTEEDAQQDLVALTHHMQDITGGLIQIHPFEGAVMGVTTSPITGITRTTLDPEERLSTIVLLTDRREFGASLTEEAIRIGRRIVLPSSAADWRLGYQQRAATMHPMQADRDQAILNDIGGQWDLQFALYNTIPNIAQAIELTPQNISRTMKELQATGAVVRTTVKSVHMK